jgi:uncharacterized coiled-coil protein SlyX
MVSLTLLKGGIMIDEKFFKEQFSALKEHIDARMDGLEKRMETTEKLLQKTWVEIEAIRTDVRLIAEGHVMLGEKFGRFESEYIRHATEMRHDVLTLYKLTYGELERRVRELEKSKIS